MKVNLANGQVASGHPGTEGRRGASDAALERDFEDSSHGSGRGAAGALGRALLRFRVPVLIAFHVISFAIIYALAYAIRFDGQIPPMTLDLLALTLPVVVAVKLGIFLAMRSHQGWWRYASFADLVMLSEAATLGAIAILVVDMLYWTGIQIPRSIVLMDWAGTLLVVGGIRGSTRLYRERYYPILARQQARRILVVGASEAGVTLARAIQGQADLGFQVMGFLDHDRVLRGRNLAGIRVVGTPGEVRAAAARYNAEIILVPTPAVSTAEIRTLIDECTPVGLKVQVVPGFHALLSGNVTVRPRDVDIHDLLCREPVKLDGDSVGRLLRGRVVVVTGAAGSIGSEICRQVLAFAPERLVLLDHNENGLFYIERELRALAGGSGSETEIVARVANITDRSRVRDNFAMYQPSVVFHAAAHKHVPMMEANPGEAVKNNVFGSRVVADEAVRAGAEAFVMISTDKAVNPTSVMGATKRLAEMYVQSLSGESSTRLVTVRFGNVLGSNGSVVPLFREQIVRGGPLTVTHPDITRFFMTISEATQLVLQAGAQGRGGEIFVLDMGNPVRVVDLARDMIRLSGLREGKDIEIVYTGLRPGEKLYEELYEEQELRLPTPHPKIFSAKHRPCSHERLKTQLERLGLAVVDPSTNLIAVLQELVPGYRRPGDPVDSGGSPADDSEERPVISASHERVEVSPRL